MIVACLFVAVLVAASPWRSGVIHAVLFALLAAVISFHAVVWALPFALIVLTGAAVGTILLCLLVVLGFLTLPMTVARTPNGFVTSLLESALASVVEISAEETPPRSCEVVQLDPTSDLAGLSLAHSVPYADPKALDKIVQWIQGVSRESSRVDCEAMMSLARGNSVGHVLGR
jgi:hypothetical protein